jgi:ArsR family transcriptional regulator
VAAGGEVCSCDLEEPLGRSQPTISHHTRALAEAGLIVGEKRGRWTMWRVVPERLAMVRAALA